MKGNAISYGAVSIVNAISIGKGAALGIKLKTEAEVRFDNTRGRKKINTLGSFSKDSRLCVETVKEIMKLYGSDEFEVTVKTNSEIPPGKGLKSSSAAANAIVLASFYALSLEIEDLKIINLGVNASLKAGVTITGALDDSCASYFGGFVVTDNIGRKLIKRVKARNDLRTIIYIPDEFGYTKDFDINKILPLSNQVLGAYNLAFHGKYWEAMIANGKIHSNALGFDLSIAEEALDSGALCSGLTGTGPAVAAVCEDHVVKEIRAKWKNRKGIILETFVNNQKAEGRRIIESKS